MTIPSLTFLALLAVGFSGCKPERAAVRQEAGINVECGVGLGLTEQSGVKLDWADVERRWTASRVGDQITLTRSGMCGDECAFREEIVLGGLADDCPSFVSARVTQADAGSAAGRSERTTRAQSGALRIQDWDVEHGRISGRLEAEIEFTFYVTLLSE